MSATVDSGAASAACWWASPCCRRGLRLGCRRENRALDRGARQDAAKWSLDGNDIADLVTVALRDGRYDGFEWCARGPDGPWAACDAYGELTVHNDPRVLPVGRWLRKSKINELPQLLNVWLGYMSIAGPRPQTPRRCNAYPDPVRAELIKVRPGLSGMGAILFRNEDKMMRDAADPVAFYDQVIMPYKGEVERWYIQNRSVKNYFLIIIATIWIILFPKSRVAWKWFKGLPRPPAELAA